MRIAAIALGLLTLLLRFSLSVKAQAPLELPDLSAPEPSREETETPEIDRPDPTEGPTENTGEDPVEAETEDEAGESPDQEAEESPDESNEDTESEAESPADAETADAALPPLPEGCEPLPLVSGEGSEVTKRTSPPSFTIPLPLPGPIPDPRVQSNWNTDWYIPNAQEFNHYRVILMPRSNGRYSIQMYFKYPDDTSDQFYENQEIRLTTNQPLIIEAEPRSDLSPYQVNANIGGILSIGVRYTIVVAGCHEG